MPRSAPTVDGLAFTYRTASFRMIDTSGDLRTVSLKGDATNMTDANIEAIAVALGAVTRADVYSVEVTEHYTAVASTGNATFGEKSSSVYDNVVLQNKNAVGDSVNFFIPAPLSDIFLADAGGNFTDNVDSGATLYTNLASAVVNVLETGFQNTGVRYTERREVNTQQKL